MIAGPQPKLRGEHVVLRPFALTDAADVQRLAGAPEIADTTLHVPHPYEDGVAEAWIATHAEAWTEGVRATYAVTTPDAGLVGAVSLVLALNHRRAELGYWIGVPFWGRGYATEASAAVVALGFDNLDLNRIQATHLVRNPASGRVMQKIGMVFEGVHREMFLKNGTFEDVARYAILRADYVTMV